MCEEKPVPVLAFAGDVVSSAAYGVVGSRAGRAALAAVVAAGGVTWLAVTPITLPALVPVLLAVATAAGLVATFVAVRRARAAEAVAASAIRRAARFEERLIALALPADAPAVSAVAEPVAAIEAPQVVAQPGWPSWTETYGGRS